MFRKYKYAILFIVFLGKSIFAQDITAHTRIGYGTYFMDDLKSLQNSVVKIYKSRLGVQSKVIQNFPAFYNYQLQFTNPLTETMNIGIFGDFASTGSRIHYSDYSGELSADMLVKRYALGLQIEQPLNRISSTLSNFWTIQFSGIKTVLSVREQITIYDMTERENIKFIAYGFGLEPGLSSRLSIWKLVFGVYGGAQLSYSFPFRLQENREIYLRDQNIKVMPQWLGFRVAITIGITP